MLIKVLLEFHRGIVAFFCLRVAEPINGDGGSYNRKFTVYYDYLSFTSELLVLVLCWGAFDWLYSGKKSIILKNKKGFIYVYGFCMKY